MCCDVLRCVAMCCMYIIVCVVCVLCVLCALCVLLVTNALHALYALYVSEVKLLVCCMYFICFVYTLKSHVFQLVKMTPCGHAYGPHKRLHSAGGIHKDHMNMFGSVGLLARTYRKRREL